MNSFDSSINNTTTTNPNTTSIQQHSLQQPQQQSQSQEQPDDSIILIEQSLDSSHNLSSQPLVHVTRRNATTTTSTSSKQHLTLREQETVIDDVKKENFSLKLKIYFLEERLAQLSPASIDQALREHIELKVEFQTLRQELKRYKKLLLEAERVLETRSETTTTGGVQGWIKEREEWRERLNKQEEELKGYRDRKRKKGGEHEDEMDEEDARAEIARLRAELDHERDSKEELLADHHYLKDQFDEANDLLEAANDKLKASGHGHLDISSTSNVSGIGEGRRAKDKETRKEMEALAQHVEDLESDKFLLATEIESLEDKLSARDVEMNRLENENEQLEMELARGGHDRSHNSSRDEEEMTRDELLQAHNKHRDLLSSHALAFAAKEQEVDDLLAEIDALNKEIDERVSEASEEWRSEVEAMREQVDKLTETLAVRDGEINELIAQLDESEAGLKRDEADLEELNLGIEGRDAEIDELREEVGALEGDLKKLGEQIFELEEEAEERQKRVDEVENELDGIDRQAEDKRLMHEQVVIALKEKFISTKKNLEAELNQVMDTLRKQEDERQMDLTEWQKVRREEEGRWQSVFDTNERALHQSTTDLATAKSRLQQRESDLLKLQTTLNAIQSESRRRGESATSVHSALEMELERIRRDSSANIETVERMRDECERMTAMVARKDLDLATINSECKDTAAQLAGQIQTRLALSDKFDQTTRRLRDSQNELSAARDRLHVVEDQLNSDNRALSRTETQYRDQLTERNTLLLTVYQNLDKLVGGSEKTPRKAGYSEPKPFTNFNLFHDTILRRMKAVAALSLTFERRSSEIESSFTDQFASLKRSQESRLRQLDRFESSVKAATETQRQWRQRVIIKQTELDAAKMTNQELQSQLASLRHTSPLSPDPSSSSSSSKITLLTTRSTTAERRLAATQAQLTSAETKLEEAKAKVKVAESKWEARLRELESRLKASEEKVKRERQGAKERVKELGENIRNLEGQVQGAGRRNYTLGEVIRSTEQ